MPLHDFDFRQEDQIKYQPYKTQGHVTIGDQTHTRSEWIRIDSDYLSQVRERKELVREKPQLTTRTGHKVDAAICELYEELMVRYLPARFPTIFQPTESGGLIFNLVTGSIYPATNLDLLSPAAMLTYMSENVEEDFYLVCPDDTDGQYRLDGHIVCPPGGFLIPARVSESVRELHQPVPGYERNLGLSDDHYFARMIPGDFIGRMNWSLQVDGEDMFRADGDNYHPGTGQEVVATEEDPKLSECFLRVEHQTLTKLPRTGAVVITVHSYKTPLSKVREDGDGVALADAVESMPEGLAGYKMRQYWGNKVLPWLNGGPGDDED